MKKNLFIIREAISHSLKDKISLLGAALSFHGLFSLVPMFLILISIGNAFFDGEIIHSTLMFYLQTYLGNESALFFDAVSQSFFQADGGIWFFILAGIVLLYASTNIFSALHQSFEAVYDISIPVKGRMTPFLFKRAIGIISLVFIFTALFLLAYLNILLDFFGTMVKASFSSGSASVILQIESVLVSFLVIWALFAIVYKLYSHQTVNWRSSWYGAFFGSISFIIITSLIKTYFVYYAESSALFALAGSVIAVLLWVYYVSQGFLFGAEVAKSHDRIVEKA